LLDLSAGRTGIGLAEEGAMVDGFERSRFLALGVSSGNLSDLGNDLFTVAVEPRDRLFKLSAAARSFAVDDDVETRFEERFAAPGQLLTDTSEIGVSDAAFRSITHAP